MKSISRLIISGVVVATGCSSASALTVNVEPGTLSSTVIAVATPESVTDLTVTGSLNAADFDFFAELTALKSLDLSGATITAYSGSKTSTGITQSDANVLPDCAFLSSSCTSLALPQGITEIGAASLGNSKIQSLTIPATVKKIDTGAFSGMTALKSLTIPSSVTSLGNMLFKDCSALESVVINAAITALPESTFSNCTALTSVTLPSSITAIGNSAFAGCTSLTTIALPSKLTTIGDMAFANSGLTEIDLSSRSLKTIGAWAFAGCSNLKSVTGDLAVTSFGIGTFFSDSQLAASLGSLANSATAIPDYLLYGATSVTSENFNHTKVDSIGDYALSGMTISEISLPSAIKYLGNNAMERWDNVAKIDATVLTEVPSLGESVWSEVDQPGTVLLVDSAMVTAFQSAGQWKEFKIETPTMSNSEIVPTADNNLRAFFDGAILLVESDLDITAAQLYDVAGRCINIVRNQQSNRLSIDTAPFDTRVFLLRLLFDNQTTAVLKLAR